MVKLTRSKYLEERLFNGTEFENKVLIVEGDECNISILGNKSVNNTVYYQVVYKNQCFRPSDFIYDKRRSSNTIKWLTIEEILESSILVYDGWITPKNMGLNPFDSLHNGRYTVYIEKGLRNHLSKVIVDNDNLDFILRRYLTRTFNLHKGIESSEEKRKRTLGLERIYAYFNSMKINDFSIINRYIEHGNFLDMIFLDLSADRFCLFREESKEMINTFLYMLRNINNFPKEYLLYGLQNMRKRFKNTVKLGIGFHLACNGLEKIIMSKDIIPMNTVDGWLSSLDNRCNSINYIRNELTGLEMDYTMSLGENNLLSSQSLGIYTTPILHVNSNINEEVIMNIKNSNGSGVENPEIMNAINSIDDNKKIFMYKDIALSLEDIQSRIDNIDSEDTRSEVLNDLSKLKQRMLEYKVQLAGSGIKGSEFDSLDSKIDDAVFDTHNYNIFSLENIAMSESLGLGVYGLGERKAFGEINPYRVNDLEKLKERNIDRMKRVATHVDNFVVKNLKIVGNAMLLLGDLMIGNFFETATMTFSIFRKAFDSLNILFGASFGDYPSPIVTRPIQKSVNQVKYTYGRINRNIKKGRDIRRNVGNKVSEFLAEGLPYTINEQMEAVTTNIYIPFEEAGIFDAIKNGRQKIDRKVSQYILSKFIKRMNNYMKSGKEVDAITMKYMVDINKETKREADTLLKNKEISPKEHKWILNNLLYKTEGAKVSQKK